MVKTYTSKRLDLFCDEIEGKLLETQYFGKLDEGIMEILRILAIIDEKFRI